MNKAKSIIKTINELQAYYEVSYYEEVGEHGSAGSYPTFERALAAAKKVEVDEGTWYVGVEGEDKFAVVHIRDEYLTKRMGSKDFADEATYKTWLTVAKKALETGQPQVGKW